MTSSEIKAKYKASRSRLKQLTDQIQEELVIQKRLEWASSLRKLKRWFLL